MTRDPMPVEQLRALIADTRRSCDAERLDTVDTVVVRVICDELEWRLDEATASPAGPEQRP